MNRGCNGIEDPVLVRALTRAADGVFVVCAEGIVVMWNRAAERILGYSARSAVGRRSCELIAGEAAGHRFCYGGCHGAPLIPNINGLRNFDAHTNTKAGKPIWVNVSALGIASPKAGRCLTVHVLRDVTAAKRLLGLIEERLPARGFGPEARPLTRREREILGMLSLGLSTRNVTDRLHVSKATVRNHVQSILAKLGVHSRLEAVAYATSNRLI
jgi:PAS domain S-box-containing protein